jgi:four helix bundle protein
MKPHYQLQERALAFGADALPLCEPLLRRGPLYRHIGEQLFRAASSIGAHVEEGQVAASRKDMAAKYAIGLREARESLHWLRILQKSGACTPQVAPMAQEANEIVSMLTTSVKHLRNPEEKDDER